MAAAFSYRFIAALRLAAIRFPYALRRAMAGDPVGFFVQQDHFARRIHGRRKIRLPLLPCHAAPPSRLFPLASPLLRFRFLVKNFGETHGYIHFAAANVIFCQQPLRLK